MAYRQWCGILMLLICQAKIVFSQDAPTVVVKPTPEKEIILAVPDLTLLNPEQTENVDALKIMNQVLWEDLKFAGYFTLAAKGFYPPQAMRSSEGVDYDAWNNLSFKINYLSTGTVKIIGKSVIVKFQLYDLRTRSYGFGSEISSDINSVRSIAHRWADDLVYNFTAGGSRGIASTKIAYESQHGAAKEVSIMDYDGYNPRDFTSNRALNKYPAWSSDSTKIAFQSDRQRPWEIYIYSLIDGTKRPFPTFSSTATTPSFSPDGTRIAFALTTPRGDMDIFVSKLDGSDRMDITNNPAVDTSPTWAPSGRQIAFASKRDDSVQIYVCDADGTNVRRLVNEGGEADSPSWSPDGKWVVFEWKPRKTAQFDIYIAEVGSGQIRQLTSSAGNNTNPSWAPDGRHIVFASDRTGTSQIYIMQLSADPSDVRMITTGGNHYNPAWGPFVGKE